MGATMYPSDLTENRAQERNVSDVIWGNAGFWAVQMRELDALWR